MRKEAELVIGWLYGGQILQLNYIKNGELNVVG